MRELEPGWIRVCAFDSAQRRALWMRVTDAAVEFCSGREGDDDYCSIPRAPGEAGAAEVDQWIDVLVRGGADLPRSVDGCWLGPTWTADLFVQRTRHVARIAELESALKGKS